MGPRARGWGPTSVSAGPRPRKLYVAATSTRLEPASTFDDERLAALFTAVYAGYWHPIEIDATGLRRMVTTYDFDLDASVVALDGDEPIGVGMLAARRDRGWIGGMGVVPDRRGTGIGTAITERLLEGARSSGVGRVRLEVLEQNAPAIAVYRKLGFLDRPDVVVWQLAAAPDVHRAEDADLDEVLEELSTLGSEAPWQRNAATIARMREGGAELRGVRAEHGAAVFSTTSAHAALHDLEASTVESARALLRAPFERGAASLLFLNGPSAGIAAAALRAAGATRLAVQHELEWRPGA